MNTEALLHPTAAPMESDPAAATEIEYFELDDWWTNVDQYKVIFHLKKLWVTEKGLNSYAGRASAKKLHALALVKGILKGNDISNFTKPSSLWGIGRNDKDQEVLFKNKKEFVQDHNLKGILQEQLRRMTLAIRKEMVDNFELGKIKLKELLKGYRPSEDPVDDDDDENAFQLPHQPPLQMVASSNSNSNSNSHQLGAAACQNDLVRLLSNAKGTTLNITNVTNVTNVTNDNSDNSHTTVTNNSGEVHHHNSATAPVLISENGVTKADLENVMENVTKSISAKIDENGQNVQKSIQDTVKVNRYPGVHHEPVHTPARLFPTNAPETPMRLKTPLEPLNEDSLFLDMFKFVKNEEWKTTKENRDAAVIVATIGDIKDIVMDSLSPGDSDTQRLGNSIILMSQEIGDAVPTKDTPPKAMIYFSSNDLDEEGFDQEKVDELVSTVGAFGMKFCIEFKMEFAHDKSASLSVTSCDKDHGREMIGAAMEVVGILEGLRSVQIAGPSSEFPFSIKFDKDTLERLVNSPNARRGCIFSFKLFNFNDIESAVLAKSLSVLEFENCGFAENSFAKAAVLDEHPLKLRFVEEVPHLDMLGQGMTCDVVLVAHVSLRKMQLDPTKVKELLHFCKGAGLKGWTVLEDDGDLGEEMNNILDATNGGNDSQMKMKLLLDKTLYLTNDVKDRAGQSLFGACHRACLQAASAANDSTSPSLKHDAAAPAKQPYGTGTVQVFPEIREGKLADGTPCMWVFGNWVPLYKKKNGTWGPCHHCKGMLKRRFGTDGSKELKYCTNCRENPCEQEIAFPN